MTRYYVSFDNGTFTDQPGATADSTYTRLSYGGSSGTNDKNMWIGWHTGSWQDISGSLDSRDFDESRQDGVFIPWDNSSSLREVIRAGGNDTGILRYPSHPAFISSRSDGFDAATDAGVLNNANSQTPSFPFVANTVSYSLTKAYNISLSMSFWLHNSCSFSGSHITDFVGNDPGSWGTVEFDQDKRYIFWEALPPRITNVIIVNSNFNSGGNTRQIHLAVTGSNPEASFYALWLSARSGSTAPTRPLWTSLVTVTQSFSSTMVALTGSWTTNIFAGNLDAVRIKIVRLRDTRDSHFVSDAGSYAGVPVWWIDVVTN